MMEITWQDGDVERVVVVGTSGAGKSWLAHRLAEGLGVDHVELDAIHHLPGWTPLPAEDMRKALDERCPADGRWVADGNYGSKGGDLLRERADTIVWLDLPRRIVMGQLVRRTLRRVVRRQRLWNGNRESLRNVISRNPERSILRWAWTTYKPQRAAYAAEGDDRWVRLTTRDQARKFVTKSRA